MSDTTAIPQADGAAAEQPTTLQRLNQAIYEYGMACLNQEVAHKAQGDAYDAASKAEAVMMAFYRQFQAEQRGGK